MGDMKRAFIPSNQAGTLISDHDGMSQGGADYSLPGTYAANQETLVKVIGMIDGIGHKVEYSYLSSNPPTVQNPGFIWAVKDQGFSEYDINRHDYSSDLT